jgi:hypothetical protein
VKFEVGNGAVGQPFFLTLKPPISTVIPLTFNTHTFLLSYAEEEEKPAKPGDFKKTAKGFLSGIRRVLRQNLNFQPSKG